jgi:hypothetical protein
MMVICLVRFSALVVWATLNGISRCSASHIVNDLSAEVEQPQFGRSDSSPSGRAVVDVENDGHEEVTACELVNSVLRSPCAAKAERRHVGVFW